jgi:hypothetical protein
MVPTDRACCRTRTRGTSRIGADRRLLSMIPSGTTAVRIGQGSGKHGPLVTFNLRLCRTNSLTSRPLFRKTHARGSFILFVNDRRSLPMGSMLRDSELVALES